MLSVRKLLRLVRYYAVFCRILRCYAVPRADLMYADRKMCPRFVQVSPATHNAINSTALSRQAEHHDEHCAYHDMVPGLRVQSIVSERGVSCFEPSLI